MDIKPILMKAVRPLYGITARKKYRFIREYIKKNDTILDIGSGSCYLTSILRKEGYIVQPIDIKNYSMVDSITPIIFDGEKIKFKKKKFSVALLINVLHHTSSPVKILKEAKKVSDRIIIIEDIFDSKIGKLYTCIVDSILSWEFLNHPHSNMTDSDWKKTFRQLDMNLIDSKNIVIDIQKASIYYLKC